MNQPNFGDIDVQRRQLGDVRRRADRARRWWAASRKLFRKRAWAMDSASPRPRRWPLFCRTSTRGRRPDSVGFAAPVVDLKLFEADAQSGVGELLVRGPNVVKGYWNKPEATAETFVDGWLHTGDLARIDADGFVQIVDRKKDMVNRGGENVYCVEVENALAAHPAVFEVAVMGVPDEMMGEKVGAVVVLNRARRRSRAISGFRKERLADFKVPQYLVMRQEPLARNPGGKVLKARLRKETEWGKALR